MKGLRTLTSHQWNQLSKVNVIIQGRPSFTAWYTYFKAFWTIRRLNAFINSRVYKGGGGGWMPSPHKVFLEFFQDELLSRLTVFSRFAHIPYAHFDTSLVRISRYGYELWRHKWQLVKPFLKKNACCLPFLDEKCKNCQQKAAQRFNYDIFYISNIKNFQFWTFFDNF